MFLENPQEGRLVLLDRVETVIVILSALPGRDSRVALNLKLLIRFDVHIPLQSLIVNQVVLGVVIDDGEGYLESLFARGG